MWTSTRYAVANGRTTDQDISIHFSRTASRIINTLGSAEPSVMTRLSSARLRCADMFSDLTWCIYGVPVESWGRNDYNHVSEWPESTWAITVCSLDATAGRYVDGRELRSCCLEVLSSPSLCCRRTCRTTSRRSSPPSPSPVPAVPLWCATCSGPWDTWPPSGSQVVTSLHHGIVGQDRDLGLEI